MVKSTKQLAPLIQQTKERALARNKSRLADLLALMRRRLTEIVEGFYDVGEAFREILENKLYAVAGHRSFGAFLKAEGLVSLRQANRLIVIVRKVPREQALALGQERAYALVTYTNATPEADSPGRLLAENALVGGKPVTQASSRDFLKAARDIRAKTKPKRRPTSEERQQAKAAKELAGALRGRLRGLGISRAQIKIAEKEVHIALSRTAAESFARSR